MLNSTRRWCGVDHIVHHEHRHQQPLPHQLRLLALGIEQALLGAGARVDHLDRRGQSALVYAAWAGNMDAVQILLQAGAGAEVDVTNSHYKMTPLMHAAGRGHTATVQALLRAGPKIDQAGYEGWTALLLAPVCGRAAIVQMLLEAGADKGALSVEMNLKERALSFLGSVPSGSYDY